MASTEGRYEFSLIIKCFGYDYSTASDPLSGNKPKMKLIERLRFNDLTAVGVIQKMLNYLRG